MYITDLFNIGRADLTVNIKCKISSSEYSFCNRNPRIVMAEDSSIFFVSRRIRRNFTKFQMISGICRLEYHDTIFRFQMFMYGIQRFLSKAFFFSDFSHYAESLWFNINFTFFTFF